MTHSVLECVCLGGTVSLCPNISGHTGKRPEWCGEGTGLNLKAAGAGAEEDRRRQLELEARRARELQRAAGETRRRADEQERLRIEAPLPRGSDLVCFFQEIRISTWDQCQRTRARSPCHSRTRSIVFALRDLFHPRSKSNATFKRTLAQRSVRRTRRCGAVTPPS